MRTDLSVSHVAVAPGEPLRVPITVTNTATVIDGVTAIIDGLNPDWVRLEQPLISLFPEASGDLELIFDVPRSCPAGDYLIIVRVVSTIEPERQAVHDFWLTVGAIIDIDLSLRPEIVSGGKSAKIQATVVNTGNSTTDVTVSVIEPTREIDCLVRPSRFSVPQDSQALADVAVRSTCRTQHRVYRQSGRNRGREVRDVQPAATDSARSDYGIHTRCNRPAVGVDVPAGDANTQLERCCDQGLRHSIQRGW
jgi:hypothetical protein